MGGSRNFIDQMGRCVTLNGVPKRVVSMVPSQTELLFDLGLEKHVVGVTKFCLYPGRARRTKVVVGGTKRIHLDTTVALKPDLIIGNKEENTKELVHELSEICPVWMSDILDVQAALNMIEEVGYIFEVQSQAQQIIADLINAFNSLVKFDKFRVLYFIWKDPYIVAASETFIDHILKVIGLENAARHLSRYPSLEIAEIKVLAPDIIFLSSEPYPFNPHYSIE